MNYFGIERKRNGVKKLYKLNKEKSFLTLEDNAVKTWKLSVDEVLSYSLLVRELQNIFGTVVYTKNFKDMSVDFMFDATKKEAEQFKHLGELTCV